MEGIYGIHSFNTVITLFTKRRQKIRKAPNLHETVFFLI